MIALFLFVCMLLSVGVTAYAEENLIDSVLLERGYPQIVLDTLCDEVKLLYYNSEEEFAGAAIQYYREDSSEYTTITVDENGEYVVPYGQISDDDMTVSLVATKYSASNKLVQIQLTYNYSWENRPADRHEDAIAISWKDGYTMVDGGFYKANKYDYYTNVSGTLYSSTYDYSSNYMTGGPNGVDWGVPLAKDTLLDGISIVKYYGYGRVLLNADTPSATGTATFYATYVHTKTDVTVSFTYNDYQITVNCPDDYDKLGTQKTVYWDYS